LDAFPSGSYAVAGLLRLRDIVETTDVPTAAVECKAQPRMLINPKFVEQHAATSEKLLMLVMHELHHVLLGHTTLFPRITPVQNFIFDAVINGVVSRMFPGPEYTAFFTDFFDAAYFTEADTIAFSESETRHIKFPIAAISSVALVTPKTGTPAACANGLATAAADESVGPSTTWAPSEMAFFISVAPACTSDFSS
jgi:hypothetical protein